MPRADTRVVKRKPCAASPAPTFCFGASSHVPPRSSTVEHMAAPTWILHLTDRLIKKSEFAYQCSFAGSEMPFAYFVDTDYRAFPSLKIRLWSNGRKLPDDAQITVPAAASAISASSIPMATLAFFGAFDG